MPKANKHAEVKPSKYKTSLCQFYLKGKECPYAARCAFAHGEHELQSESRNVELLKATGLQRLDGPQKEALVEVVSIATTAVESHTPSTNSVTGSVASAPLDACEAAAPKSPLTPTSPVVRPRRRMVMVSLPKQNTSSEMYQSPYNAPQYDPCYTEYGRAEFGYPTQAPTYLQPHLLSNSASYTNLYTPTATQDGVHCDCRFSATCSQGQPSKYRHNPYGMTGRIAQCA